MKIGFIGCGNMGGALISGLIRSEKITHYEIYCYDVDSVKLEEITAKHKLHKAVSLKKLCEECEIVVVAIKPTDVLAMLTECRDVLDTPSKTVISIAAGLKTAFYRNHLKEARIVRVMPNTPAVVGEGAAGLYFDGKFSDEDRKTALEIFQASGEAEVVSKEDLIDSITGLSGSGPAYVFMFINSLADAGVMEGLPRDMAKRLAVQTVLGSAMLAKEWIREGVHFEELKDRVTSPGGTTASGLFALEEGAFRATVMRAVRSATTRAKELGAK